VTRLRDRRLRGLRSRLGEVEGGLTLMHRDQIRPLDLSLSVGLSPRVVSGVEDVDVRERL